MYPLSPGQPVSLKPKTQLVRGRRALVNRFSIYNHAMTDALILSSARRYY